MISRKRGWLAVLALLVAALAIAVAGCGGDDDDEASGDTTTRSRAAATGDIEALPSSSCTAIEYEGEGDPDVLIASDFPLQGSSRTQTTQIVEAIRYLLEQQDWKAGDHNIAYQSCDDATAQAGKWDSGKCSTNAQAYAANEKVVGVIGTFNSGCARSIIPVLNQAPGGGVAMMSPANTYVCLTEGGPGCDSTEPDKYYPTGTRNYARVVAHDAYQGAAVAEFMKAQGVKSVYVLNDKEAYGLGVATNLRNAAEHLGIEIAGFAAWDPKASELRGALQPDQGHRRGRRLPRRPDRRERRPGDQGQGRRARPERRRRSSCSRRTGSRRSRRSTRPARRRPGMFMSVAGVPIDQFKGEGAIRRGLRAAARRQADRPVRDLRRPGGPDHARRDRRLRRDAVQA